jgi:DNA-binding transcriptional LysR family regulator
VLLEEPSQSAQLLEEWLRTQTIDPALIQLPAVGTKTTALMRDELCAILPTSSPLGRRRQVSIRDLAAEPFIMSRYTSEPLLQAAYARHHLTPSVRFEVQDRETLVSMVREGLGFSIVPFLAFPAYSRRDPDSNHAPHSSRTWPRNPGYRTRPQRSARFCSISTRSSSQAKNVNQLTLRPDLDKC